MVLTKQDIEAIRGAVQFELQAELTPIRQGVQEIKHDVDGLREQIQQLAIILDNFVKMMTDYQEEFSILKAEVDQMKRVFKEKFGVEIAAQHSSWSNSTR
ncbi:MAG: hypothetical protein A3C81_00120 [Candidatus Yanofskybacteria bacterium RIFCSPHIGHO2_02_FULL_46_19]|uniref:Uncharacterized protein n=1 Tax=Candidatus Yanofskybacteria bacterium RIFCSPHIGHO2_02_FULL_46_19 TaxID=1802684 RepID=A0A1F8FUB2_9BACT|nr:MAG: hypothetical protein A3C81_00120 [Candidatus Yanofskybacteria bacterium RIFCSPHIGHO2_02_FULL_46_19]